MKEINEALKEKELVLGKDRILKKLRQGNIKKIFLAGNCPKETEETITHYANLNKAKVIKLKIDNKELGTVCKKPFSVMVMGY